MSLMIKIGKTILIDSNILVEWVCDDQERQDNFDKQSATGGMSLMIEIGNTFQSHIISSEIQWKFRKSENGR